MILGDDGEVIAAQRLLEDPEKAAEELLLLEEGKVPPSLKELVARVEGLSELVVEDDELGKSLAGHFPGNVLVKPNNKVARGFRDKFLNYMRELGLSEEYCKQASYETSLWATRRKVKKAVEKRDLFIAQAISALDDITKTINLFASRVREWYGLHFPELDNLVGEHEDYMKVVSKVGGRESITRDSLLELGIDEKVTDKIVEAAKTSMGADLAEFDLQAIRLVSDTLDLFEARRKLEKYIDEAMMEVAPNVRGLVGPLLGARLIALAGGLSRLATLPASTIQVLGAEKALFRALRTGGRPPKHGVIFQHLTLHRAPRWQRGKIARALAAKLAIAARVDAFTGEYKAEELKSQLEQRIQEIKTLYAKPPKRQPTPAPPRRRGRGRRGGSAEGRG